ncbi:MAG: CPBP family intramembrane metalloprotease [Clostridiales bacterium]|jgi:membrane protease YdiL (CAAX protease family)|nr:CPBP family intramembrane metalloprotease [Clostridiales bacterium]
MHPVKRVLIMIGLIGIYLGYQVVVSVGVSIMFIPAGMAEFGTDIPAVTAYVVEKSAAMTIPSLIISSSLSLLTLWLILRKEWKRDRTWRTDGLNAKIIGVALFVGITSNIFIDGIITLVGSFGMFDSLYGSFEEVMNMVMGEKITLSHIFALGIIGPVVEEIIFRGAIFSLAKKAWGYTWAIYVSAFLFGLMHGLPLQIIYATGLGILYGYIYKWTKRLWVTVVAHVANNVFTMSIGLLIAIPESMPDYQMAALYVIATVIGLAATIFFIIWLTKHQTPEDAPLINLDPEPSAASN